MFDNRFQSFATIRGVDSIPKSISIETIKEIPHKITQWFIDRVLGIPYNTYQLAVQTDYQDTYHMMFVGTDPDFAVASVPLAYCEDPQLVLPTYGYATLNSSPLPPYIYERQPAVAQATQTQLPPTNQNQTSQTTPSTSQVDPAQAQAAAAAAVVAAQAAQQQLDALRATPVASQTPQQAAEIAAAEARVVELEAQRVAAEAAAAITPPAVERAVEVRTYEQLSQEIFTKLQAGERAIIRTGKDGLEAIVAQIFNEIAKTRGAKIIENSLTMPINGNKAVVSGKIVGGKKILVVVKQETTIENLELINSSTLENGLPISIEVNPASLQVSSDMTKQDILRTPINQRLKEMIEKQLAERGLVGKCGRVLIRFVDGDKLEIIVEPVVAAAAVRPKPPAPAPTAQPRSAAPAANPQSRLVDLKQRAASGQLTDPAEIQELADLEAAEATANVPPRVETLQQKAEAMAKEIRAQGFGCIEASVRIDTQSEDPLDRRHSYEAKTQRKYEGMHNYYGFYQGQEITDPAEFETMNKNLLEGTVNFGLPQRLIDSERLILQKYEHMAKTMVARSPYKGKSEEDFVGWVRLDYEFSNDYGGGGRGDTLILHAVIPDNIAQQIVEQAKSNPQFAMELFKALYPQMADQGNGNLKIVKRPTNKLEIFDRRANKKANRPILKKLSETKEVVPAEQVAAAVAAPKKQQTPEELQREHRLLTLPQEVQTYIKLINLEGREFDGFIERYQSLGQVAESLLDPTKAKEQFWDINRCQKRMQEAMRLIKTEKRYRQPRVDGLPGAIVDTALDQVKPPRKLYLVGDLHGNKWYLARLLEDPKICMELASGEAILWTGGDGVHPEELLVNHQGDQKLNHSDQYALSWETLQAELWLKTLLQDNYQDFNGNHDIDLRCQKGDFDPDDMQSIFQWLQFRKQIEQNFGIGMQKEYDEYLRMKPVIGHAPEVVFVHGGLLLDKPYDELKDRSLLNNMMTTEAQGGCMMNDTPTVVAESILGKLIWGRWSEYQHSRLTEDQAVANAQENIKRLLELFGETAPTATIIAGHVQKHTTLTSQARTQMTGPIIANALGEVERKIKKFYRIHSADNGKLLVKVIGGIVRPGESHGLRWPQELIGKEPELISNMSYSVPIVTGAKIN